MIFYSHGSEVHFYKQGLPLNLSVKVRVSGSRKWPKTRHIILTYYQFGINKFVECYCHIHAHWGPFFKSPGNYWAMKDVLFTFKIKVSITVFNSLAENMKKKL